MLRQKEYNTLLTLHPQSSELWGKKKKNKLAQSLFTKINDDASKQHWNKHEPIYFQMPLRIMRDVNMNLKLSATGAATLPVSEMKQWQPRSHRDPACQPELCFRGSHRSSHSGVAMAVAAFSSSLERWACWFQLSPQPASCLWVYLPLPVLLQPTLLRPLPLWLPSAWTDLR